jgi:hypothetical protein
MIDSMQARTLLVVLAGTATLLICFTYYTSRNDEEKNRHLAIRRPPPDSDATAVKATPETIIPAATAIAAASPAAMSVTAGSHAHDSIQSVAPATGLEAEAGENSKGTPEVVDEDRGQIRYEIVFCHIPPQNVDTPLFFNNRKDLMAKAKAATDRGYQKLQEVKYAKFKEQQQHLAEQEKKQGESKWAGRSGSQGVGASVHSIGERAVVQV